MKKVENHWFTLLAFAFERLLLFILLMLIIQIPC